MIAMQQVKTRAQSERTPIATTREVERAPLGNGGHASKWAVLAVLAMGIFMTTLDTSIVNISLPSIAHSFTVPLNGAIEWVMISYLVVIAGVLLTFGRLADLFGRKTLWIGGLVVFTLGSAICGAAPTLLALILARAFQGVGGALIMSVSLAILTAAFPPEERGRALGLNAVIVALGTSSGPTLGGLITQYFSWHWIFYVNVPLGVLGMLSAAFVLKERGKRVNGRFDPAGALLLAVGLVTLTLGLSFGQQWGWRSPALMVILTCSVLAFVLLIRVEQRVTDPVIDLHLLRSRMFVSAHVSLILSFLALFAVNFLLPFYLEELRGFSVIEAGLLLSPLPLTVAMLAPFSGMLADRIGTRWLAALGLTLVCVGLALMSQMNVQSSLWHIIWCLAATGVGQGLFQAPNNSALMGAVPRTCQGVAAGLLATGRVVGQSISVAMAGAIFTSLGGASASALLRQATPLPRIAMIALQHTFTTAFHAAFIVCAIAAAIGVFTSLVRGKEEVEVKRQRTREENHHVAFRSRLMMSLTRTPLILLESQPLRTKPRI